MYEKDLALNEPQSRYTIKLNQTNSYIFDIYVKRGFDIK